MLLAAILAGPDTLALLEMLQFQIFVVLRSDAIQLTGSLLLGLPTSGFSSSIAKIVDGITKWG